MTQSNVNKLANIISKDLVTPNNTDNRIGIVSSFPGSTLSVGGTVIADKFLLSDGSEVGGAGGIGTALSAQGPGKDIFYIDKTLGIGQTITIDIPTSSSAAYILNQEISVTNDADVIVADGDDFILDVLGLSTEGSGPLPGTGGRVRVGQITGPTGVDAPTFTNGLVSSGIVTATNFEDSIGKLRNIPQNAKTGAYVPIASDTGKHISITTGGVTIPAAVFSVGDVFTIYNNSGSTQIITQGGSVTLRYAGTSNTGNRNILQYGLCTVLCVSSNNFVISGTGLS